MTLEHGKTLGRYEILAPLGAGGMGEVYRAKDTKLDREVAVKVLPQQTADDPLALARFEREAKAVAAISHPNILAIHDVGNDQGIAYVVTELLEGETLRDRLRRSAIPWRESVDVGASMADGLSAAHARGIIHRDLKPENIFLTADGVVKLLDFGLARVEQPTTGLDPTDTPTMTLQTRPGTIIGTIHYMSPEQVRGLKTEAESDIFSFGCVLYEMLTGRRAFAGQTSADTMTAILKEEPPSVTASVADVTPDLDRLITRCLNKKPEQRFHSASDLAFTLRTMLSSGRAPGSSVATVTIAPTATRVGRLAGGVFVAALLIVAGFLGWRELRREPVVASPTIRSVAVLPFKNLSGDTEQEYFVDGITGAITDDLAKISALSVTNARTMMRYKGSDLTLPRIAREITVDAFVIGDAIQIGDRVQIRARLVEAATGRQLWSDHYERDKRDILKIYNEVARAVAEGVKIELTPSEQERLTAAPMVNWQAYDAYARGRELVRRGTRRSCRDGIALFDTALAIDPKFALAYAAKATAFQTLASTHLPPSETLPEMEEAARAALAIDDGLVEAHVALGNFLMQWEWDWTAAGEQFARAVELNPSHGGARVAHAAWLSSMNRGDEAMAELDMAVELDPTVKYTVQGYHSVAFGSRRFERCVRDAANALSVDADYWLAHQWGGLAHSQLGHHDDAIQHLRRAIAITESPQIRAMLGGVLAVANQPVEARRIRKELKARQDIEYVCPYEVATISIGLGEYDQAFEEISEACDDRAECIPYLQVDPRLDPIRDDPRFDRVLERVGFEPPHRLRLTEAPRRLAVLPFENRSTERETAYLCDEIPASIIDRISRLAGLQVTPRSSAFRFRQGDGDAASIGRELDVDVVLTGYLNARGKDLRIRAELIDVATNETLWSERYDRKMDDILAIEEDIATKIFEALRLKLTDEQQERLTKRYTENFDAYRDYLQGRFWWNKRSEEGFTKALEHFQQAIDHDPKYALALSGLADTHSMRGAYHLVHSSEAVRGARRAAQAALRLDPTLAEAHVSMAAVHIFYDWDWASGAESFRRALELNPNYPTAHHWFSYVHLGRGDLAAAIATLERARQLDPLSLIIMSDLGRLYRLAKRYSESERILLQARELDANFTPIDRELSFLYLETGRLDEAIKILEKAYESSNRSDFVGAALGQVYGLCGRTADARDLLRELKEHADEKHVSPVSFAAIHASLDETDQAIEFLEQAYLQRDPLCLRFELSPALEQLQSDPRVADLMRRGGFTPVRTPPVLKSRNNEKPERP